MLDVSFKPTIHPKPTIMNKKARLILLAFSLIALLVVGRAITGSFEFALTQFWFTSGLFLLIFLSLIDQPTFSKDANVFGNAITGWMSLMLIPLNERSWVWWTFFYVCTYLIVSSYILIWLRKKELSQEHFLTAFFTRINREIGKPETLFSTFFIWGGIRQFGLNTKEFDALLLYWMIFMILNMPAFATALSKLFEKKIELKSDEGQILKLIDPNVAEILLPTDFPENLIGKKTKFISTEKEKIGEGIIIDERIISGSRVAKVAITTTLSNWKKISDTSRGKAIVKLLDITEDEYEKPVSVVDKGTTIDLLVFYVHPSIKLEEGEITFVQNEKNEKVFYQIVGAIITEEITNDGNILQSVKVHAGQLGLWNDTTKKFSPYAWVPSSGKLIYKGGSLKIETTELSNDYSLVGKVPNSNFPVHTYLEDIVTHNTAIIGVTGSGKSYLTFHLIESLLKKGIKVMILDLTREHLQYLHKHNPYALKQAADVKTWLTTEGSPNLAIHQFATSTSFPFTTFEFTKQAFEHLSTTLKLKAGKNLPASLCIIYEEAHSLIPEWNQVTVQSDKDHVNNTARIILQGRKFGLGCMLVTQRTANVTKTILNQCNSIFALQSFDQTGLDFLRNYMGEEYSGTLSRLPQRQAILVGKASSSQKPIIFKIDDYKDRWESPTSEEEITST